MAGASAAEDAELAFRTYAGLIRNERRQRFLVYEDRGREILRAALRSPAKKSTEELINVLAGEGIFAFRDLLEEIEAAADAPTDTASTPDATRR